MIFDLFLHLINSLPKIRRIEPLGVLAGPEVMQP